MCGQVDARHNLGCMEYNAKNYDLALQHWMISAKMGHEGSLTNVKSSFQTGWMISANLGDWGSLNTIKDFFKRVLRPRPSMLLLCAGTRTPWKKCRALTETKPIR